MDLAVVFILAVVATAGVCLVVQGHRGRVTDDHSFCRRCGFDLTGRPAAGGRCAECGANLVAAAIRVGNRRRRPGLLVAGASMVAAAAMPALVQTALTVTHTDPIRYEPIGWLLREVARSPDSSLPPATDELCRRLRSGRLSPADQARIVAAALGYQADLSRRWDRRWGDAIEALNATGHLPAADWKAYLAHDQPATLTVRPRVAVGGPIPFEVHGEVRGGTAANPPTTVRPDCRAAVPGTAPALAPAIGSCRFGQHFKMAGTLDLPPAVWGQLRPGPQPIVVAVTGAAGTVMPNPALFAPITLAGNWTLLPPGDPGVELYRDEATAAAVQRLLTAHVYVRDNGTLGLEAMAVNDLPADIACDVFLVAGQKRWTATNSVCVRKGRSWPSDDGPVIFRDVNTLTDDRVDVVLRPSAAAAARTVAVTRVLDHEFVFHDVRVDRNP